MVSHFYETPNLNFFPGKDIIYVVPSKEKFFIILLSICNSGLRMLMFQDADRMTSDVVNQTQTIAGIRRADGSAPWCVR